MEIRKSSRWQRALWCRFDGWRLTTTAGADTVEIAVSDQGRGLSAEQLDQVFTPFFTSKATGLGIGLAICRRIIDAHGGRIWIENNPDRGATARFTLPIRSA